MAPRVAAIVIARNEAAFVEAAVRSTLAQTVTDLEVVAVDDGSTDGTLAALRGVSDRRLRLLTQAPAGPNAARNAGLRATTAPWVAFLDADDRWHPRKLEAQLAVAARNPAAGLVYCACESVDEQGNLLGHLRPALRGHIVDELALGNRISGSASAACVRREVFEAVGPFDEALHFAEDWEMWLRIAARYEVDFSPEVLVTLTKRVRSHGRNPDGILAGALEVLRRAERGCFASKPARVRAGRAEAHYTAAVNFAETGRLDRELAQTLLALRYDPTAPRAWRRLVLAPARWLRRRGAG